MEAGGGKGVKVRRMLGPKQTFIPSSPQFKGHGSRRRKGIKISRQEECEIPFKTQRGGVKISESQNKNQKDINEGKGEGRRAVNG